MYPSLAIHREHIAKEKSADSERHEVLLNTFAEWYLLSKGDEAMFNRLWSLKTRTDKTLYPVHGRLSGFAKTMWAFNLRSDFYASAVH